MSYDPADNSRKCYDEAVGALRERLKKSRVVIGDCVLYNEDCRFVLPTLRGVDAVVTDPPYGIGWARQNTGRNVRGGRLAPRRNVGAIMGDDAPFDPSPWLDFPEVLLFGANHFATRLPDGRWHAWDKLHGWASHDKNSDVEFIWMKGKGASRIVSHLWKGVQQDSEKGAPRFHISQKPVAVMLWCLQFINGQTILDPFMGSGSTGVACVRAGRKFIGIELDPKHFATARRRIEEAYAQRDLFVSAPEKAPEQMSLV